MFCVCLEFLFCPFSPFCHPTLYPFTLPPPSLLLGSLPEKYWLSSLTLLMFLAHVPIPSFQIQTLVPESVGWESHVEPSERAWSQGSLTQAWNSSCVSLTKWSIN